MAQTKAIEITLIRSRAGTTQGQRATLVGLGLRRIGQTVVRLDNPSTRGMIKSISHMLRFKKASLGAASKAHENKTYYTVKAPVLANEKNKATAQKKVSSKGGGKKSATQEKTV